jgi:hypothetical protein
MHLKTTLSKQGDSHVAKKTQTIYEVRPLFIGLDRVSYNGK